MEEIYKIIDYLGKNVLQMYQREECPNMKGD